MFFRNFDNYYQDYDYDSDTSPSPPFQRSGSPPPTRTSKFCARSSPPRRKRPIPSSVPVIGDDGWEVLPAELLDPSNWGLPRSSLSNTPFGGVDEANRDNTPKMYPGGISSKYPVRNGVVMQFYPDHDPDLINTNQLDGMPYVLQNSNIPSKTKLGAAVVPNVVVNAAYNASSSAGQKKLSFSQRWEQGLLEMAHSNPETLLNYSLSPLKRGGFKSFVDLRWDKDGGQQRMESSGDTVPSLNIGDNDSGRGRGQTAASAPRLTVGYTSRGPDQPLRNGGGGGTPGYTLGDPGQTLTPSTGSGDAQRLGGYGCESDNSLPNIHQTPPTLGGGCGSAASSKAADAALHRDAATKVKQMPNKARLKIEKYMKEMTAKEKAAAKKENLDEETTEAHRIKQEKLDHDRKARGRKAKDWIEKTKDVRTLAAEAATRRDAATKDLQHERAESLKKKRIKEERENGERARARVKQHQVLEEKNIAAQKKRDQEVKARNTETRKVKVKIRNARQSAAEASQRRYATMKREKLAEERSKPFRKPATEAAPDGNEPPPLRKDGVTLSLVCEDCGKLFGSESQASAHVNKSGHQNFAEITAGPVEPPGKSTVNPSPTLTAAKKDTPETKPAPAREPEKKSFPTQPAPKSAPQPRAPPRAPSAPPSPTEIKEEKLSPRERVRLATAMRETAIRALPAEEPSGSDLDKPAPPRLSLLPLRLNQTQRYYQKYRQPEKVQLRW